MPASAYCHYDDPNTGKTILLPQLYPHARCSGTISSEEIDRWVAAGKIPIEACELEGRWQEGVIKLCKSGDTEEKFESSALKIPSLELTDYLLKNKGTLHGESLLHQVFLRLEEVDPDVVWLSFVKEAITLLASRDPLPIHFFVARKYLRDKHNIVDPSAVDVLAREIVEHCCNIQNFKIFSHPVFSKVMISPDDLCEHFEDYSGGILSIDLEFIKYLEKIGGVGKKEAKEVKANCVELFQYYKTNSYPSGIRAQLWGLWVVKEPERISPFMYLIAKVAWNVSCVNLWNRRTKQVPAVAKPIVEAIKPMLNSKKRKTLVIDETNIACVDESGYPLVFAPSVDKHFMELFKKGIKDLGSLTAHRLLRWQVNTGFEKWSSGDADPRAISIDGGYSHIASLAGCPSTHEIAKVKAILHVQAYGQFIFPDGSKGNMINLTIRERYKNREPSKICIVLGDMLLPNYVFKIEDRRERRLIPIGDLPPLFGSKNTHAQQALLQLLVFEEFSNQSSKLVEDGFIVITQERWKEMAVESGLNPQKVEEVANYWCQPDHKNCFLDKQGDEYRLSTYYSKPQEFLEYQGKQRILNSNRGKASAIARKKAMKKVKKT